MLPLASTRFLMPPEGAALNHWAVIACDQFGTDPSYWQNIAQHVGDDPSLLHCIIRDTQLRSPQLEQHITKALEAMARYRQQLVATDAGVMLVERWLPGHHTARQGVLLTVDLEQYDFRQQTALIRPTEGTIKQRLPIRQRIREQASLDISHILLLIDDPERQVIEPLFRPLRQPLYATELMAGGGTVSGSLLEEGDALSAFFDRLEGLMAPERYRSRYHLGSSSCSSSQQPLPADPLLMVVGDGNHSLAAAKLAWETHKAKGAAQDHPSRYALVELANLHSRSISFQPIHRLLRGVGGAQVVEAALGLFAGSSFSQQDPELDFAALWRQMMKAEEAQMGAEPAHKLPIKAQGMAGILTVPRPAAKLEVATVELLLQALWQELEQELGMGDAVDYVHELGELARIAGSEPQAVGIMMPRLDKSRFFEAIIKDGPLPPKAFSIGEGHEKRYYLETRSLL